MKPPAHDPGWSAEIQALYHHDMREIWDPTIARHIWNQYHNQLNTYLKIAGPADGQGGKRILDVGCAQGTLALLLAERGHDVLAVDLRPAFLAYARSRYTHGRLRFQEGNALQLALDEQFDIVFANQIIEHLVYPARLVAELNRLLAPGGQLVVTTPSWHYALNKLPSFKELGDPAEHEHKQFTADGDGHFFAYRADELEQIFRHEGLNAVSSRFFETPFISGHLKVRYLHDFLPPGLLRRFDRAALATPVGRLLAHQLLVTGRRA